MSSKETEQTEKKESKNINGCPYNLKEFLNWIMKHVIIDFYYPFMFFIYFLFVASVITTSVLVISLHWYLIFAIGFTAFALMFIYRFAQRKFHKIKNIGNLNEDGWREFEFKSLDPEYPILKPEEVKYRIGFVGDIMKMDDYKLKYEKRIQKFFDKTDLILGNLEGIILTDQKKKGGMAAQNHNKDILTQLEGIFKESPNQKNDTKWLLCVANNHSADFDDEEFKESLKLINEREKFIAIGDKKHAIYPWDNSNEEHEINIVVGTMWSNKKTNNLITRLKECKDYNVYKKFNILFPHWHYENESYVRSKIQRKSINLMLTGNYEDKKWLTILKLLKQYAPKIKPVESFIQRIQEKLPFFKSSDIPEKKKEDNQKWDLIFGHHPHVPQPIKNYGAGILAYSGGNFTSSKRRKKHISGLIMKCEIGKVNDSGRLVLGKVEWSYTLNLRKKYKIKEANKDNRSKGVKKAQKIKEVTVIIDCRKTRQNYFEDRHIKFARSLIIFWVVLGGWLGFFWIYFTISFIYWALYALLTVFEIIYLVLRKVKVRKK